MTTQEALQLVEQMRLSIQADGKTHDQIRLAIETLRNAVLSQQSEEAKTPKKS